MNITLKTADLEPRVDENGNVQLTIPIQPLPPKLRDEIDNFTNGDERMASEIHDAIHDITVRRFITWRIGP